MRPTTPRGVLLILQACRCAATAELNPSNRHGRLAVGATSRYQQSDRQGSYSTACFSGRQLAFSWEGCPRKCSTALSTANTLQGRHSLACSARSSSSNCYHTKSSSNERAHQQQPSSIPTTTPSSLDPREAAKFAALARQWWDTKGPFAPLHRMNPVRCRFIRDAIVTLGNGAAPAVTKNAQSMQAGISRSNIDMPASSSDSKARVDNPEVSTAAEPFVGLSMLDVGCGGGLLSESLARLGASVHGVDVSEENVQAAKLHAANDPLVQRRVRYENILMERLAEAGFQYDVVVASEVIEHVHRPDAFVAALASLVKPGGHLFISTLNRTLPALALAVGAAEYVLGLVPRNTHDWRKFITPEELALMAAPAGLTMVAAAGMHLDVLTGRWSLNDDLTINYIVMLTKRQ